MAQVHRAALAHGTAVAIKVLHAGADVNVREDIELMKAVAAYLESEDPELAQLRPTVMVAEFATMMDAAIDLRQELSNLQRFRVNFADEHDVVIPTPYPELSREKVLTMAMIQTHHAIVDGISGTDLLAVIMDISPDAEKLPAVEWTPEPAPSGAKLASQAIFDLIRSPYEQVRAVRASTRMARNAFGYVREVGAGLSALAGIIRPTPPSSLNGPIGPHRRYAWASTSVADIKAVRQALGGTFNDVVLAAITSGFRDLLLERGESVDRVVRTLVPVSVRPRDDRGRAVGDGTYENKVSAMFAELPVSITDPVERLHAITAQMNGLKDSHQAVAGEALTSMSGFAPPMLLALGMRIATRMAQRNINTVTTNVPGPQFPLYVVGRRMIKAFPYVPLAGQIRIGLAIFSYDGQVNFGITGDYDSSQDLDVLARGIEEGMKQLVKTAEASNTDLRVET